MKVSKAIYQIVLVVLYCYLQGCGLASGTHSYVKEYKYDISKMILEKAVHEVILNNANIYQDTSLSYYNDNTKYIRIKLLHNKESYDYIFCFLGNKDYWDTSKTSSLFIAYAYDKDRKGGSGNSISRLDIKLRTKLTEPFEKEFIDKIDKQLRLKHREDW